LSILASCVQTNKKFNLGFIVIHCIVTGVSEDSAAVHGNWANR
jgi:hypothetical protein